VSFLIQNILSDPNARSIGFGWDSPLETPFWTFVKTGTSKDYRDNWCVGSSSRFTVAVWAGNFNSEAMHEVSGVAGAGPAWSEIMTYLHRSLESKAPETPSGVVATSVRHPWQSRAHIEYFLKGTEPAHELVDQAQEKIAQIVFPAEGSVLVKDPHLEEERQALFVRFKGDIPEGSWLELDGRRLGVAISPFKIERLERGSHTLSIQSPDMATIAKIRFLVK
jgi:penicillin-binding protein 1C